MLRAVVGQDGIREVALQQLRAPSFPLTQIADQFLDLLVPVMPAQQFCSAWWGTGTRIEERDFDLSARKSLVDNRDVANNESEKQKAYAGLCHSKESSQPEQRYDIAEAEGDESRPAHIEIGPKCRMLLGCLQG